MFSFRATTGFWMIIPAIPEKYKFFDRFKMCESCLVGPMCLIFTDGDNNTRSTTYIIKPCEEFVKLAKKMEV